MVKLFRVMLVLMAAGIGGAPAAICQWICAESIGSTEREPVVACCAIPTDCADDEAPMPCASECTAEASSDADAPCAPQRCCDCSPCYPSPRVPAPGRPTIDPPAAVVAPPPWLLASYVQPQMRVARPDDAPARARDHSTRQAILCVWVI